VKGKALDQDRPNHPCYALRPATAEDRQFVEAVYFETQRYLIEALFGWRGDAFESRKFAEFYDSTNTSIVVVENQNAGWLTVERRPIGISLEHLYLAPQFQDRGIGTVIVADLIGEGRSKGLPLRLSTAKINRALRLYERLGFRQTANDEFKAYLELP
jgi:ribosomal protein S18 acetylase RimI-like enzyme